MRKLQQPFDIYNSHQFTSIHINSPVAQSDPGCLAGDKDGGFHEVFDKTLREASFILELLAKPEKSDFGTLKFEDSLIYIIKNIWQAATREFCTLFGERALPRPPQGYVWNVDGPLAAPKAWMEDIPMICMQVHSSIPNYNKHVKRWF